MRLRRILLNKVELVRYPTPSPLSYLGASTGSVPYPRLPPESLTPLIDGGRLDVTYLTVYHILHFFVGMVSRSYLRMVSMKRFALVGVSNVANTTF